jgi:HEAT repeat protein
MRRAAIRLLELVVKKGESQASSYATIALGRIAPLVRDAKLRGRILDLLRRWIAKGPFTGQPYAALALGLAGRAATCADEDRDEIRTALRDAWATSPGGKNLRAAVALGLGLVRDAGRAGALRNVLRERAEPDGLRASCALALALMGHEGSRPDVLEAGLSGQAPLASAALGDPAARKRLLERLPDPRCSWRSAGPALGALADPATVETLVGLLKDRSTPSAGRWAAAIALGHAADRSEEPVAWRLLTDLDYRSMFEALEEVIWLL